MALLEEGAMIGMEMSEGRWAEVLLGAVFEVPLDAAAFEEELVAWEMDGFPPVVCRVGQSGWGEIVQSHSPDTVAGTRELSGRRYAPSLRFPRQHCREVALRTTRVEWVGGWEGG